MVGELSTKEGSEMTFGGRRGSHGRVSSGVCVRADGCSRGTASMCRIMWCGGGGLLLLLNGRRGGTSSGTSKTCRVGAVRLGEGVGWEKVF